jgi:hypothetical protein
MVNYISSYLKKAEFLSWTPTRDFVSKLPRFSYTHLKVSGLRLSVEKVHLTAALYV